MGVPLVCWCGVPGWATPTRVEDVVRMGRDIIEKAWGRDREWFEKDETLGFLFMRKLTSDALQTLPVDFSRRSQGQPP